MGKIMVEDRTFVLDFRMDTDDTASRAPIGFGNIRFARRIGSNRTLISSPQNRLRPPASRI